MKWPHHRFALVLLVFYLLLFAALAFKPVDLQTWAMENTLGLLGVLCLVLSRNRLPLSRISYVMLFVFLCLHTIGAHYTYSLVPYDDWSRAVFGVSINEKLGWTRNNYDRFVHLCYGLLVTYPMRELFLRVADAKGFWGYFFPLDVMMSTSMLYELLEWAAAKFFGGELGALYIGTQGDEWDAQKDMALAALGALIAMTVTAIINWRLRRDFAREWAQSLRVKHRAPLGEDEIARQLHRRDKS